MGKAQRDKGARFERKIVNMLKDWGLVAMRVPLSGAVATHPDDVVIEADAGDIRIECKKRKKISKYLTDYLNSCDLVCIEEDRGQTRWLVGNETMRRLLLAYANQAENTCK